MTTVQETVKHKELAEDQQLLRARVDQANASYMLAHTQQPGTAQA